MNGNGNLALLPDGWTWVQMSDLGQVASGGTPSTKEPSNFGGSIPWITPADLSGYTHKLISRGARNISEQGLGSSSAGLLPAGTVLFSSRAPIGYVAIATNALAVNQGFKCLVPNAAIFNEYLYYYLKGCKSLAESYASGTTFLEISGTKFGTLPVPLPPLPEQKRIVAKIEELFTRLDAGVAALKQIKLQLKRYRQAVLKHAFEGKLTAEWRKAQLADPNSPLNKEPAVKLLERIKEERKQALGKKYKELPPVDTSDLPELPEGWVWGRLGDLVLSVKDGPHYSPQYAENGIPFITGGNVRPEGVDFSTAKLISEDLHKELSKRCHPDLGDVLYTKGGTTGIARVNTYDFEFNVWVHVAVLKLASGVLPFFIQHMLNSPECYRQSQRFTHGVGNQDLGLTRMINITIPLPPVSEQKAIIDEIERELSIADSILKMIDQCTAESDRLRQSILKRAFEGKLVPQDPNDEPAAKLLERIRAEREGKEETKQAARKAAKAVRKPRAKRKSRA